MYVLVKNFLTTGYFKYAMNSLQFERKENIRKYIRDLRIFVRPLKDERTQRPL